MSQRNTFGDSRYMLFHAVVQGEDGGREEEALRSWLEPLTGIVNDLVSPEFRGRESPTYFLFGTK